jgi:hypothetical protein
MEFIYLFNFFAIYFLICNKVILQLLEHFQLLGYFQPLEHFQLSLFFQPFKHFENIGISLIVETF